MVRYKKIYLKHYEYCETDFIPCKVCGKTAVDIHHVVFKSQGGKDEISNLIALCRECHIKAHNKELTEEYLKSLI